MSRSRFVLLVAVLALLAGAVATSGVPSAATPAVGTRIAQTVTYTYPSLAQAAPTPAPVVDPAQQPAAAPAATSVTTSSAPASITINIQPGADDESQILEAVYQKVNPAVVKVVNLAQTGAPRGFSLGVQPQGEGSGFLWDRQGHIVTNDHVISGADKLQVVLADGTELDATLVGTDPGGDIAVIQVDAALVASVAPVEQADLSQLKVGAMAIAIGNPFGFQNTMTRGIVSALGRSIPSQTQYNIPEAIQTDAAINPGNSGGPLLDVQGRVIGVNDQIESDNGSFSGVGFAIPIDLVQRIVPALIKDGQYQHPYLGITGDTFSRTWADALGLPADSKGVYVMDATGNGPADRAGVRGGTQETNVVLSVGRRSIVYLPAGGDLLTAMDGQPLTKMDDLLQYLEQHGTPGQKAKLTIVRNGKQQIVTVTLGVRPDESTLRARGNGEPQA